MTTHSGRCACGAVTVTAGDISSELSACWCETCRRWQGLCGWGLHAPADQFRFDGPVRGWQSSPIAERCFCGICASALWFRPLDTPELREPAAGLFANFADATLHHENFVERRPPGITFTGAALQLTAADYARKSKVFDVAPPTATDALSGGCACGAVRFHADALVPGSCGACHCATCQRWTGGAFVAVTVRAGALHVEGRDHLLHWRSSDHAERVSCGTCGSKLWYHITGAQGDTTGGAPGDYEIALGAFDDMSAQTLHSEIFIEHAPTGIRFAGDHPRLSGDQARAQG